MPIQPGNHLGLYEILAAMGAGGMGEVYRARDAKLGRDVAIKVLPEKFARDAERMARFQREAKFLASLNHPNIASIYGLEDSDGTRALVMELVEGPTLAGRIRSGPIPMDEALPIARQICDALEYAHERGIVHRDLKPSNIKVTSEDTVKVLDFGLAKAMAGAAASAESPHFSDLLHRMENLLEGETASADVANSPTLSQMATQVGILLGTAAYMSPEQAKGKPVDRRTDIWAFGCVLYEMLTGTMAFGGDSVTDTLAAVIRAEPDWSRLPAATPVRVRMLLQRCLQKDPKQRLRDIGDARISLDEVLSDAPDASLAAGISAPLWRRALPWVAAALVAAIASLAAWNLKPSPSLSKPVTRFTITLPPGQRLGGSSLPALALSADGSLLAYVATAQSGTDGIYLRAMNTLEARPISGTEGAVNPFFSPDSQWLGFFAGGKLKKISVNEGVPVTLADAADTRGASWGGRGTIIFAPAATGSLEQVSDRGGTPEPFSRLDKEEISHRWPEFLPGSNAVLFISGTTAGNWIDGRVEAQLVGGNERRTVVQGAMYPHYVLSGHLIYAERGNLMAVAFDSQRLLVTGPPVAVARNVSQQSVTGTAQYAVSDSGSLVYVLGGLLRRQSRLVWVSRDGTERPLAAPVRDYEVPRLSPDGRRVAVNITDNEGVQVWLYDLGRDALSRLTFQGTTNGFPVWTPDGRRIAFSSSKEGTQHIFWQPADGSGTAERLFSDQYNKFPTSFSPDGQQLAFSETAPAMGADIWVLHLSDRQAQPYLRAPIGGQPQLSPDGHWLAYISDESGRYEVYVQPYPGPGGKWQISTDGGAAPVWNRNGRELFYRNGDKMMAVDIDTRSGFVVGKPTQLFVKREPASFAGANYDVSPDGQRFLMLKPVETEQEAPTQINVVLNWFEELKRLVPTGK